MVPIVSSVTVSGNGRHLFGVGADGRAWQQDLGPDGHPLAGWFAPSKASPIVSNLTVNGSHLFGVGGDGKVYVMTYTGYALSDWSPVDSSLFIASDVSVSDDGRFMFAVGRGGMVYLHALDASGKGVGVWVPTSDNCYIVGNVTVDTDSLGKMHLFGLGTTGQVFEQDLNAYGTPLGGWDAVNPWDGLAGNVTLMSDYGFSHLFSVGKNRLVYEMDLDFHDHARPGGWFATSTSRAIYSDASVGAGWGFNLGLSALGGLTTEPAARRLYAPAKGTLFYSSVLPSPKDGVPSYLDVQQGKIGDCWLLAGLAEVAARAPADITSMFTYLGKAMRDGYTVDLYNVRLYDGSGAAHYFTVDTLLPMAGSYYDRPVGGPGSVTGSGTPVLWVALAEKAYAVANGYGFVTTRQPRLASYEALHYGQPRWALQAITRKGAYDYMVFDPFHPYLSPTATAWSAGQLVTLSTPDSPTSPYIVGDHVYAVVNYDPSSINPFQIFNPWGRTASDGWVDGKVGGTYGLFWANDAALRANFVKSSLGAGAAPGRPEDRHALSFQELPSASMSPSLTPWLSASASNLAPSLPGSARTRDALFAMAGTGDESAKPPAISSGKVFGTTGSAHDALFSQDNLFDLGVDAFAGSITGPTTHYL